ncbi:sigma-70 family RNA polymerase sigma factor [Cellulomonas sp. APG4]|uniref:RNA polymerase sigma factor n=1 Tax=Cellulomonas sp. APG4 TaxID=1538656 RepID=UPI0013799556|nr:sigma-70 family RNA polymerase sigma factor [Cellulomonas sp. APG4]NCT90626.1 sigma-70 family RNA polymerase sigma factor [Cellulomonas sp. APG4]
MRSRDRDAALAELVRTRGEPLTRYAYLFTGDVAAAQDLVQDALVKVVLRTRSGFEATALEAYVRRTIANLYVDGYRRGRTFRRVQHLVATPEHTDAHDAAVTDNAALTEALGALSPQERAVVVLRFFEDMTQPQVADAMGLATGTVKRYLSNALTKLERHLGPIEPPADDDDATVHPPPPQRAGRS